MKPWRKFAAFGLLLSVVVLASSRLAAAEPDRLTPADAELVLTVNVRRIVQSPAMKKHGLEPLKTLLQHNGEIVQLLKAGIDPLQDLDTITAIVSDDPQATGRNAALGHKFLIVARGRFDPEKTRRAAEDYAKKHPDRLEIVQDGERSLYKIPDKKGDYYAAFANKHTLVMAPTKQETLAVLRRAGQQSQTLNKPLPLNKPLRAALDKANGEAAIWMAMTMSDKLKELLKSDDASKEFAASVQSITGALELHDDARLAVIFHAVSPDAATKIKGKLDEAMTLLQFLGAGKDKSGQLVKEVLDSVKTKSEKNEMSVRLQITDAQIEKAIKKDR
jgi:hypothetical protein